MGGGPSNANADYTQSNVSISALDIKDDKREKNQDKIIQALMNNSATGSPEDLPSQELQIRIRMQVERKYANLIRNAHLYLAYMYLISYNFIKCIYHGKILIRLAEEAKNVKPGDKSLKLPNV